MHQHWEEIAETIAKLNGLGEIETIEKINIGFNSAIYRLNEQFVIKICKKEEKEAGIKKEIAFYQQNDYDFHPKLITSDSTKKDIPYIYLVEESINGTNLIDVWGELSNIQRKDILLQLLNIMKSLHRNKYETVEPIRTLMYSYDEYLKKLSDAHILPKNQIEYLENLRRYLEQYFLNASVGYIHGDIHFNNLILTDKKIKIIDFENYQVFPIDKDFDSINRMVRQPESYKQNGNNGIVAPADYTDIIPFFKENYKEICDVPYFEERLLIYDCLNSLKWVAQYPNHELYHDVLFNHSKRLIR